MGCNSPIPALLVVEEVQVSVTDPHAVFLAILELVALARIPNAVPAPAGRRMKIEIKKGIAEDIIGYHLWDVTSVLYLHSC